MFGYTTIGLANWTSCLKIGRVVFFLLHVVELVFCLVQIRLWLSLVGLCVVSGCFGFNSAFLRFGFRAIGLAFWFFCLVALCLFCFLFVYLVRRALMM